MKSGTFKACFAAFPVALCAAIPSYAQTQLKETVVTATRTSSLASALVSDVTVITREDIDSGTGRTLTELIARSAGVSVSSNGGLGKASTVNIRGTESRHVLLLVDGVRYGSSTTGTPNFDTIPLELIDRIEVLKGPASSLYGSDAVGGVIQIFTRKGKAGLFPYASLTVGEGDRGEVSAGVSGGDGRLGYAIGLQSLTEKGFSATNSRASFGNFNADRDGFSQNSVNVSLDYKLTETWKVDAKTLQINGVNQYDSSPNTVDVHADVSTSVSGIGLEGRIVPSWKTRLEAGLGVDKSTNVAGAIPSQFNTEQQRLSWTNEVESPVGTILAGLETLDERVSGTTAYTVSSRTTDSAFAGLNGSAGVHSWQVNTRQDNNSQFGTSSTGMAGYGYKITPDLRVRGSYGTSFKVPSFNTLYYPGFGNATTQPEKGVSSELGLNYAIGSQLLSLTYYSTRIQGFITTLPVVTSVPYARMEGWTLSLEGEAGQWDYRTSLDLLDARNEANGLKLVRRPDLQWTSSANYTTGQWKWGASLLAASESYENAANTQTLGGYGTVDVFARYAVRKDWSVEGRVVNIGDKFYQTAMGFNQPGRGAYVTLRYQPK